MNAIVTKEVEALNRIQARNNSLMVVDEEPGAVECIVYAPGYVEVNGRRYLAAPLREIAGRSVWVAYYPSNPEEEVSVYFDDAFFTEALPYFDRGDKFLGCQLRVQRKIVERLNMYTRKALELSRDEYDAWCVLNKF